MVKNIKSVNFENSAVSVKFIEVCVLNLVTLALIVSTLYCFLYNLNNIFPYIHLSILRYITMTTIYPLTLRV